MTIAQRIELRRLGYTKEEVAEMIEEEKNSATVPVTDTAKTDKIPECEQNTTATIETNNNELILNAIKDLTSAIQANNVLTKTQPVEQIKQETVADIFNNILGG